MVLLCLTNLATILAYYIPSMGDSYLIQFIRTGPNMCTIRSILLTTLWFYQQVHLLVKKRAIIFAIHQLSQAHGGVLEIQQIVPVLVFRLLIL